jgi:hypothetical protein
MSKQEEGELKKRILLIAGKGSLMPLLSPQDVANKIGDILGEVFEILDEVKQDFCSLLKEMRDDLEENYEPQLDYDGEYERLLKKWFGSRISKPSSAIESRIL